MKYATHFNTRVTPQTQAIPGREADMVTNSAGGVTFQVDDWTRLERFLVLGSEGGSYYASEKKLTIDNAKGVLSCLKTDGIRTINTIVAVSDGGRAPKNDPAIFALALAASAGNDETKRAAFGALSKVCRTGTHLFQFAEAANALRGWGKGLRKAVANWYNEKSARDLAYQLSKYQQREGWSHRDLMRLSHPKFTDPTKNAVAHWAVKGWEEIGAEVPEDEALRTLWAFEKAKKATSGAEVVKLITDYRMARECIPTQYLTDAKVQEALLQHMPVTAMIRNLGNLTKAGVVAPLSDGTRKVVETLRDVETLKKGRVHPLSILLALKTYESGKGFRGSNTWSPVPQVVDALNDAFYLAFQAVEPTGKRFLLSLDVSGSMGSLIAGTNISCREAAAALSLVTAATEKEYAVMAFGSTYHPLSISPRQRLTDVTNSIARLPFQTTDCSLPMVYALEKKIPVDVFCVYTDSETYAGRIQPVQALNEYRNKMGIPAKLVVLGLASNGFTIADKNDAGMLDVVGFDSNVPAVMRDFIVR